MFSGAWMQIDYNVIYIDFINPFIKTLLLVIIVNFTNGFPQEINSKQKQEQVKIFSLNDCLKIALENNHKIKAQKQGILISEARKKQAESGYWPQVSAKAAYSFFDQDLIFSIPEFRMNIPQISMQGFSISLPPFNVPQQDIKLMDNHNVEGFLEMSLPIYTGGKIKALNQQAENGMEISRQDYRKSNLEIRYDITRYYYSALLTRKIYKIATEALERLEITLKLTQSAYENGSGKVTKLDYLKNKVVVDQVRTVVTEMKKNVTLSIDALAFTMSTTINFDIPDEELPFIQENYSSEDSVNSGNPDLAKANAALFYYQAKIDEANSGYLPKIGLTGMFAQNINSYKSGITNKFNNQIWMLSLGAEIPIFNGFRTSNEVNEAKIQLLKTKEEKLLLQDAITLQIKEAVKRIEISAENVNNILQAKSTASEHRSLTERAFTQDMVEAKDLIEAQIMESLLEAQYQKALYDHIEAGAYLNLLTGKDL